MRFCSSCGAEVELRRPDGRRPRPAMSARPAARCTTRTPRSWSAASARSATGCCCAAGRSSRGGASGPSRRAISSWARRAEAGAMREAWEEARARIELEGLMAVYSVERIGQVQLLYRARLLDADVAAGPGEPGGAAARLGRDPLGRSWPSRPSTGSCEHARGLRGMAGPLVTVAIPDRRTARADAGRGRALGIDNRLSI